MPRENRVVPRPDIGPDRKDVYRDGDLVGYCVGTGSLGLGLLVYFACPTGGRPTPCETEEEAVAMILELGQERSMTDGKVDVIVPPSDWKLQGKDARLWQIYGTMLELGEKDVGMEMAISLAMSQAVNTLLKRWGVEFTRQTLLGFVENLERVHRRLEQAGATKKPQ